MSETFKTICLLSDLIDGGSAVSFEIDADRFLNGFVVKFEGRPYAYVNRCPHVGTELDWVPGVIFDKDLPLLSCATHGALFDPKTGRCVSGPCLGRSLTTLPVKLISDRVTIGF